MTLYEEIEQILINYPTTLKIFVCSSEPILSHPDGVELFTWDNCSTAAYDADDNLLFVSASVHRG